MHFHVDEAIEVLSRTPGLLDPWLRGLPDAWIEATEGPETWSPRVVVGHLVHGEEADWIPRARLILEHGESRPFDPYDRFAQFRRFGSLGIDALLDLLAERRRENVETLRGWRLTEDQLRRKGRHPEFGPVTLAQLLATWVVHDLDHVAQVARVMAKRYATDVGPWTAYLGILKRS